MATGNSCKTCKTTLHYEQLQGMRIVHTDEDGKEFYNTYCPTCNEYSTEKKR